MATQVTTNTPKVQPVEAKEIMEKTFTQVKIPKELTDKQMLEIVEELITQLETRSRKEPYIFPIGKLRGFIAKMP